MDKAPTPSAVPPATIAAALAAVRRLSFDALEAEDEATVYAILAQQLYEVFGLDDVHVVQIAQDKSVGRAQQLRPGPDHRAVPGESYVQDLSDTSAALSVARSGEPLLEPDAASSTAMNPALTEHFRTASALFLPVSYDADVRAVMVLLSHTPRQFAPEEVALVFTLVSQSAAALAILEMRTRMSIRAERQAALARAAAALNAQLELKAVLNTLCEEADRAVDGDVVGVYLGDAATGGLAVASHGLGDGTDWYGYVIRPGEGVGGQVLVTGEPVVSDAYQDDVRVPATSFATDLQTAVGVPVRWDGELKGALSVGFAKMHRVTADDLETLQAMADLAGVACSNAEAFERAQVAARTDSLTGLLNHGAVHVRLREEIERVSRTGEELCCLLMDIDDFKAVNDLHGHLVGDQLLREVAHAVAEEFRPYDGIGRFGGDEFVVVLPGTTAQDAPRAARRLQDAIARATRANALVSTAKASVGIASWREPLSPSELLDRADRALLLAKRRGKNQVVAASQQTETELARLDWDGGGPSQLLADLWDMVSQCDHPDEVLRGLPDLLTSSLDIAECVLVHPALLGAPALVTARLDGGPVARPGLDALCEALGAERLPVRDAPGAYAAMALEHDGELHGVLVLRVETDSFPLSCLRLAELTAGQAVTALIGQAGGASRSAVAALAAAIDARDNYTHSHSEQVVALAEGVARRLGLSPELVESIRDGAMLHDVGKVAIPNEILYKEGPLDPTEWAIMREHPVIGERILRQTHELAAIAPMVRHEHERWDGGGYPDGLAGRAIPVGSRVILACDAYNAMITARPYRDPMSHEEACAELEAGAGTQFDPQIVAALLGVLAEQATRA